MLCDRSLHHHACARSPHRGPPPHAQTLITAFEGASTRSHAHEAGCGDDGYHRAYPTAELARTRARSRGRGSTTGQSSVRSTDTGTACAYSTPLRHPVASRSVATWKKAKSIFNAHAASSLNRHDMIHFVKHYSSDVQI